MAYSLPDPNHYFPKSCPYLTKHFGYIIGYRCNQQTLKGKQIQAQSALRRLEVANNVYKNKIKCEEMFLRTKYKSMDIKNAELLAKVQIIANNRDQMVKYSIHKLPHFISNKELILDISNNGKESLYC